MQPRLLNNRYELGEPLGQGGMATVYRATDIRLGRPVAVKLLHAHYANDDEFLQRFEHEAQSAAGLSAHPNIVDVYDVGQQDGVPYIVMELVEGPDLKTIIEQQGPLPIDRTLNIAQQVAEGLEYAHARGLVHRDVKPQNILVSSDGIARIADFGIAKSYLSTAVTQAGITYGTADYISPEQAQGLPATPQSDVYSLGIVVYEMLTRHLPFSGDSPMAVAVQHIQQPPPPLSRWNPSLPPSLERIIMGSLAKNPKERPASARAFASAMREYRNARGQETIAVPAVPRSTQVQQRPAQPSRVSPESATSPMRAAPSQPSETPRRRPVPVAAPPPLARPHHQQRSSSGAGAFILGLLLLAGVVGIAYVLFATDTFAGFLSSSPPVVVPTTEPVAPTSPPATGTPVVVIVLPEFVGRSEIDVVQQIEQLGLRRGVIGDPILSSEPAGTVIDQDPDAGTQLPRGSEVKILVSLGLDATPTVAATPTLEPTPTTAASPTAAVATIPNLVGQQFEGVRGALENAGFIVDRQDRPSRTVPEGVVMSQAPPPGDTPLGTTIRLVVSLGDVVAFPDVVGQDRGDAESKLRAAGLRLQLVDEQGPDRLPDYDNIPPNQVVSATANGQPVQNGELVPRGASIVLGVRKP